MDSVKEKFFLDSSGYLIIILRIENVFELYIYIYSGMRFNRIAKTIGFSCRNKVLQNNLIIPILVAKCDTDE